MEKDDILFPSEFSMSFDILHSGIEASNYVKEEAFRQFECCIANSQNISLTQVF